MTNRRERRLAHVVLWATMGILVLVLAPPGGVPPAEATHIACGDILSGSGKTFVLDSDLLNCTTEPAITLNGAILKLNGWMISCDSTDTHGVVMTGNGSQLWGGGHLVPATANPTPTNLITGCDENVVLSGAGRVTNYKVGGIHTSNSSDGGFIIEGSGNILNNNFSENDGDSGFQIQGSNNTLKKNIATGAEEHGFHIHAGDPPGGMNNRLTSNVARGNGDNGFLVEKGVHNILDCNVAEDNEDDGFEAGDEGHQNLFICNTSMRNGATSSDGHDGDGYKIEGDGNTLRSNIADSNFLTGFHAECCLGDGETAVNNTFTKNVSLNNVVFDMQEDTLGCGTDTWRRDFFLTSNDPCIK